jgi:hypothetical protein
MAEQQLSRAEKIAELIEDDFDIELLAFATDSDVDRIHAGEEGVQIETASCGEDVEGDDAEDVDVKQDEEE